MYQMLYGKRPFGEGCSQEKILRDEIMLHAKEVIFPSKPAVSAEGKDFMQRYRPFTTWHAGCEKRQAGDVLRTHLRVHDVGEGLRKVNAVCMFYWGGRRIAMCMQGGEPSDEDQDVYLAGLGVMFT